jgi:hypothetical protein
MKFIYLVISIFVILLIISVGTNCSEPSQTKILNIFKKWGGYSHSNSE